MFAWHSVPEQTTGLLMQFPFTQLSLVQSSPSEHSKSDMQPAADDCCCSGLLLDEPQLGWSLGAHTGSMPGSGVIQVQQEVGMWHPLFS